MLLVVENVVPPSMLRVPTRTRTRTLGTLPFRSNQPAQPLKEIQQTRNVRL